MIESDIKERLWQVRRGLVPSRHPVNQIAVDEASVGERLADQIAAGIGSWRFLIVQTIAVCTWVAVNVVGFINRWDPYPFVLLNLLFSVQAAYTGPVLLLAGNRQSQKDRLTLEHAAGEGDKADKQNVEILTRIAEKHGTDRADSAAPRGAARRADQAHGGQRPAGLRHSPQGRRRGRSFREASPRGSKRLTLASRHVDVTRRPPLHRA